MSAVRINTDLNRRTNTHLSHKLSKIRPHKYINSFCLILLNEATEPVPSICCSIRNDIISIHSIIKN